MSDQAPAYLRSLGGRELPASLHTAGAEYRLERLFKHDFWAVTSLYRRVGEGGEEDAPERVVLKVHRQAPVFGLPLRWIGRLGGQHERRMYQRLHDLPGIPRLVGTFEDTGFIHEFVPGEPHRRGYPLTREFIDAFQELLAAVHARDIAYVDLEKPDNVLVGEDGRPHLIDFQISFYWPPRFGGRTWPARRLLRMLQRADRYHLLKMVRRGSSDLLTEAERAEALHRPWYVRLHTTVTRPLTYLRRAFLDRVHPSRTRERRAP